MNNTLLILAEGDAALEGVPMDAPDNAGQENIVSEDGSPIAVDPNGAGGGKAQGFNPQLIFLILMVVVIYFIMFRGPKQKQKKHKQMVQSLQKNDKVRTIGGIIGTVIDVKDNEVVLKIDESNNTKIKITKGAIAETLSEQNGLN